MRWKISTEILFFVLFVGLYAYMQMPTIYSSECSVEKYNKMCSVTCKSGDISVHDIMICDDRYSLVSYERDAYDYRIVYTSGIMKYFEELCIHGIKFYIIIRAIVYGYDYFNP